MSAPRVALSEVARRTGRSMRRLQALCVEGYFASARKERGRNGPTWSLAECCVCAEAEREWPCADCSSPEASEAAS
jgi:hypothetical protein